MNKPVKDLVAMSGDEQLKVFVRTAPEELAMGDLEIVAGGRGVMIVPNG
jgi:hypothetical protein